MVGRSPGGSRCSAMPSMVRATSRKAALFKKSAQKLLIPYAGAATRPEIFYQEGCLKARMIRAHGPIAEAVLMNISGGIAGGDRLSTSITLAPGTQACIAAQAAERVYRALGGTPAQVATHITVGPGAALHYLPQEAILFDGFALDRRLEIELSADTEYLGVEALVFGRLAMGERLASGCLRDRIVLRRDGRLILSDITRLDGAIADRLAHGALANGAGAMASMIFAAPQALSLLGPVRDALACSGLQAGASIVDGVLVARLLASDSRALRPAVARILILCRNGQALPAVWQS
jgi:urease accessory protein